MNIAMKFYQGGNFELADEIIIKYYEKDAELINFVQKYKEKRIVVDITSLPDEFEQNVNIFRAAFEAHSNMAIMLSIEKEWFYDLAEIGIPFFFAEGASTKDELATFIKCGASDVYIINELGFELGGLSAYCKDNKVKVRVLPNVAQTNSKYYDDGLKKFFIRPEGISAYEGIIDTIEFFGELTKQHTLAKIYKRGTWNDNIAFVIADVGFDIHNAAIYPAFDDRRVNCGKRCFFKNCQICDNVLSLAQTIMRKANNED